MQGMGKRGSITTERKQKGEDEAQVLSWNLQEAVHNAASRAGERQKGKLDF